MKEQQYYDPPRWAALMLGWLLKDQWETPLGDYEEYYNELAAEQGERTARWWYRGQVLRLLPDQLFEKMYWGSVMVKNYWLLGFRNLRKNKVAASINIIGLAAAVGLTITIFLLMQEAILLHDFHENGDRVFLVGHTVEQADEQQLWGTSPVPLGPALAAAFPQVERTVRFADQGAIVRAHRNAFQEKISFADAGFFDMFTFPLLQGQGTALEDPSAVIISSDMAAKYFRDQDPMGQALVLTFENGWSESLIVSGIADAFPQNARFTFDFLVGYEKRFAAGGLANVEDWGAFTDATFIQLKQSRDASFIEAQMKQYIPRQNEANDAWQVRSFFLDNIQHPDWLNAWKIENRAIQAPPLWELVGTGSIALLVLLISCFNYITISLGAAARRLREIGIRKTAGAEKRQLVMQFLIENLVLCFLALLGGLVLAWTVITPFLSTLSEGRVSFDFTGNLGLWIFLVGLLGFIGLVSGSYPAFYISSFQPVAILRGKLKLAEKKGLTRTLTTVQFALTLITICISLFVASTGDYLNVDDWGYNKEHTLVIPALTHEQYTYVQDEALQLPYVDQVAGSEHHIGASQGSISIQVEDTEKRVKFFGVGPSYLATMGLRVAAGRAFGEAFSADSATAVVINQTFAQQQRWTDPLGQQVRIGDQAFSVIGVVDDFLLHPLQSKAQPVVFGLSDAAQYKFLTLRVENGTTDQVVASLKTIWERQLPEVPFEYYLQTDVFESIKEGIDITAQLIGYLALFALFISCMGLFGMASQKAAQRMKEIGVRKAMGASASHVVFVVNHEFLVILGISTLIATPLCYVGLSTFVGFLPEVVIPPDTVSSIILSNIVVFLVAAVSLSMQTNKLVKVNPADVLRYE